jgi:CheY-like chemotaxis protein
VTVVLVVDDEVLLVELLRAALEEEGYDVRTAPDGQAAWEAVAAARPDVVLTDVMMPRLDGWGLYRALQAEAAYRDIPVVLMSAGAQLQGQAAGPGGAGGDRRPPRVLRKPFELAELVALLAGLRPDAAPPR